MFKLSRVSCTPLAPSNGGDAKGPELETAPSSFYGSKQRHGRGRRRNMNRKRTLVEPNVAKPHDAPMSKSDLYFALDCEMVGVGPEGLDSALARVVIVNWENEVVLDTFVKVTEPVTDYRTYVSGVQPEDLLPPDAMDFEDVRSAVKNILCGKILIGHGLENDLNALHMTHPRSDVRDSATYAPLMRKSVVDDRVIVWPRKLRDLAWEKLERSIQADGVAHNPVEDAITALDLYKSVRPTWEKDLVKEAMEKEREAETQRLRLESQMYAASVNPQNMVAHMNGMSPHAPVQHAVNQRGVPVPPTFYNRGYPQPVPYLPAPPPEAAPQRNVAVSSANYGSPYGGSSPADMAYTQPVYHHYPPAAAPPSQPPPPPPPAPQGSSFLRLPQVLVPVYFFNTKSSRRSRRQQQQQQSQAAPEPTAEAPQLIVPAPEAPEQ